jgi:hypothetical protein
MPSNPTPDEMRLALAQQNRVAVPNRPGRTMPADQAKLSYAFTHGLAPMLYGAAKGTVASIPGVVGDVNELLRDYAVPYLPTGVQQALAKAPAPFTTEQYINMMPKMGGHTENVATKLGSNVVGAMVDPFAVAGAVKRAPAVARSLAETANNKILQGESLIPGVPAQFVNPPVLPIVKPEKGGNWLTGSIEDAVRPLKVNRNPIDTNRPITQDAGNAIRYDYPNIDEGYSEFFRGSKQHSMDYADGYYKWMAENYPKEFKELSEGKTPTDYLNRFVDKKITPYIKNELATPFDSVRKLAEEKGILHMPLHENPAVVRDVKRMREQAGFPVEGVAQTPLGRQWETYADEAIGTKSAGMMIKQGESESAYDIAKMRLDRNPWLRNVDPSTNVYTPLTSEQITSHLKFDHVMDELRNAISPNSDLPQHLRLKPEALDKVTLPQAIERVAKINDWRTEQIEKAAAKSMENFPPIKEYKEGFKWHELKMPSNLENREEALDTLDKALKNEGELMGHCVGGYCQDVVNGSSRIFTLRDQKNKPHVTIEGTPGVERPASVPPEVSQQFTKESIQEANDAGYKLNSPEYLNYVRGGEIQKAEKWARDNAYETVDITQIKGKSNGPVTDKYREMVRDFLNTQPNIGKVHDLDYVDLIDMNNKKSAVSFLNDNYGGDFGVVNSSELYNKVKAANPNMDRFVHASDFSDLVNDVRGPTPEGYKDGGGVSASNDDPSMQFYSRTMDNPDNSKTTESGIIKQFEQDYMKFALQRHQAPARSDIPNAQAPAARTNIYGEYGTPALGGMVSGRVTKLGHAPDTYMGDLSYRTPVGPGMAHLGVQGMQSPQMPARMTGYNAGYGIPLGGNGFAGVNVMQPAQGGKPVLGAQVQYRKSFAKGGAVRSLESNLPKLPKTDYQSIDELMTEISKRHKTAPKKLHDDFVEKHRMTPDNWIKRK